MCIQMTFLRQLFSQSTKYAFKELISFMDWSYMSIHITFLRKLLVIKFTFKLRFQFSSWIALYSFKLLFGENFFSQSLHSKSLFSSCTHGCFFLKWALRKQSVSNVSGFKLVLNLIVNNPPAEKALSFSTEVRALRNWCPF